MEKSAGFSLAEVLVSLFLISTLILALLRQQLELAHWSNQLKLQYQGLIFLDNQSERVLRHLSPNNPPFPFRLQQKQSHETVMLDLYWTSSLNHPMPCCHLLRNRLPRL